MLVAIPGWERRPRPTEWNGNVMAVLEVAGRRSSVRSVSGRRRSYVQRFYGLRAIVNVNGPALICF